MALAKCAWASQSENKSVNGKKGDQTGLEVKRGNCYYFGQKYVIRPKASQIGIGKKIAKAAGEMADNNCFGYGQADRTSAFVVAKGINWKISKIEKVTTKCNVDCSELAGISINFAYGEELISSSVYSGNIVRLASDTKKFKVLPYRNGMKIKAGDIIVDPGHHAIVATKDGIGA